MVPEGAGKHHTPSRAVGLLLAVLVLAAGCGFPRDPEGTLERVRGGMMRVGVVEREPFTRVEEGTPTGPEVELVQEFARTLGATVEWTVGAEPRLMEALAHQQLELVIGGIPADTPYGSKGGLSQPYLRSQLRVGAPPEQTPPSELKGQRVAVEKGHVAIALLEEKGAVPEPTSTLASAPGLRAGFDWQLEAWGYTPTGPTLKKEEVLLVVPPGENGWLRQVDLFLHEHRDQARARLVEAAKQGATR
ncbi:substrate-binding periplasmic protein [Hyalangium rubrum]|uniref:Transporter substrate-binding domain-containing protein n=1 Tax=Hyalangium rubrum TaxID=3103134 RepID=A0ABU5H1L0_9BACT|nr:transporter substrate-binding domain-containing protein [Hyalangium sp. s54d21]MDY7227343.1 transporter substrate-binding domain-containing protein [Hyalangium sp. s54d21]